MTTREERLAESSRLFELGTLYFERAIAAGESGRKRDVAIYCLVHGMVRAAHGHLRTDQMLSDLLRLLKIVDDNIDSYEVAAEAETREALAKAIQLVERLIEEQPLGGR